MDFYSDALFNGKKFRALTLVEELTRKCLAIEVDLGIKGEQIVTTLRWSKASRGIPGCIRVYNGPDIISDAFN
ncbi:hypothetical protein D3C86_1883610 [compost metagenome]